MNFFFCLITTVRFSVEIQLLSMKVDMPQNKSKQTTVIDEGNINLFPSLLFWQPNQPGLQNTLTASLHMTLNNLMMRLQ